MQKPRALPGSFLPRLNDVLFITLFIGALISGPKMLNIDGDLPRHLLMGKYVIETGFPPTQEIFSYVYEGRPYVSHEWLAGVIYYLSYILLGLNGVVLLASALIATTFTIIHSEATSQNSGFFLNFLLAILGAIVTSIHWVTRPHLFTMLFLAIWLIWIDRLSRAAPVKLWGFPVLMLFWANIHAEFIAGFLLLLAYIAGWLWQYMLTRAGVTLETGKKLFYALMFSFLASLFNPAGLRTWETMFSYLNNRYLMSRITETRPPDFTQAEYLPLLVLLIFSVLLLAIRKDRFTPAQIFVMAGFGIMSLISARNAHIFGVVAPFVLSNGLDGVTGFRPFKTIEALIMRVESQINGKAWPIITAILASIAVMTGPLGNFNRFEPSVFPVDAVTWLGNNPQSGRMFNAFDWGGYILFHLWPEQKVFIESQTDVRGELTQEYEAVITLRGNWQEILRKYGITWVVISPHWDLARELIVVGWEIVYQDQTAIILIHK